MSNHKIQLYVKQKCKYFLSIFILLELVREHTCSNGCLSCHHLVSHFVDRLRLGTNKSYPRIYDSFCKIASLRQKSITRMYSIDTRLLQYADVNAFNKNYTVWSVKNVPVTVKITTKTHQNIFSISV